MSMLTETKAKGALSYHHLLWIHAVALTQLFKKHLIESLRIIHYTLT